MISKEEILKENVCPPDLEGNLQILLDKINLVRNAWGSPMTVTSGLRSKSDQIRIYNAKGITDESKMHMGSKHFTCQAVDIYDPEKKLQAWIKENVALMEKIGLWFEDFSATPNWAHFQTVAPASGHRFFIP